MYLKLGKVSCSFTSCNIANLVQQSFTFSLSQNQVCLHSEKEKFGEKKKQSAILCLIKINKTKFWNVIGYHQPDLSTYNIHEKITRV